MFNIFNKRKSIGIINLQNCYHAIIIINLYIQKSMDHFESNSHPYYLANLADDFETPSFYERKKTRIGSNFSQLKSGKSSRSRFMSSNKLLDNSLFTVLNESREGFIRDMQKQRNFQIQLLMQMLNNLVKDGVDWVNHVREFFEQQAGKGKYLLEELTREQ